jgi:hypothetical protein
VGLVPLRSYVVWYLFSEADLKYLNPFKIANVLEHDLCDHDDDEEEREALVNGSDTDDEDTTIVETPTSAGETRKGEQSPMQKPSTDPFSRMEDSDDNMIEEA